MADPEVAPTLAEVLEVALYADMRDRQLANLAATVAADAARAHLARVLVSDEAVEAAARALCGGLDWDRLGPGTRNAYAYEARTCLEAVVASGVLR